MRQIGSIETRPHAILFIDYLVSQNISAHAEEEFDGWAIWVRDENSLEMADFRELNSRRSHILT